MSTHDHHQSGSGQLSYGDEPTSGTTFAAKARAAELNAARTRRASKELEENEVPGSSSAVSLGELTKFTRPRHKGKNWRPLNLNESQAAGIGGSTVGELDTGGKESVDAYEDKGKGKVQEQFGPLQGLRDVTNLKNPHPLRQELRAEQLFPDNQDSEQSFQDEQGPNTVSEFDPDEWDPNLPTASPEHSPSPSAEMNADVSTTTGSISRGAGIFAQAEPILPPREEAKLASLGVLPPISRDPSKRQYPSAGLGQEPQPHHPTPMNSMNFASSQALGRAYPPQQYYGPASSDYGSQSQQHMAYYNQHHAVHGYEQQGHMVANPQVQMPTYYGAPPMTTKRDMLLKSLHEVVESSRARESTRTVLYDPIAQAETSNSRLSEVQGSMRPQVSDQGVLQNSEPLPGWKSRPVDIHDEVTPALTNSELAVLSGVPSSSISTSDTPADFNPALAERADRLSALEEAEGWWKADNRAASELRGYLNEVAENDKVRKRLMAEQRMPRPDMTPQRPGETRPEASGHHGSDTPHPAAGDVANRLLIEVLANFHGYLTGPPDAQRGRFGGFGPVPEWCIDKSAGGSTSFFGEDWGAPPPRVGRDPRYRPLLHEPRYTLYEELERRGSVGDIYGRRYR